MHTKAIVLMCLGVVCLFAQPAITTFAGRDPEVEADGVPGVEARIGIPRGITMDGKGNVYFTDSAFSLVLKIDAGGRLSTVANATDVVNPKGIAVDSNGNVYVVDSQPIPQPEPGGNNVLVPFGRVRKIAADGSTSTVAGSGLDTDGEDIPATQARLASSAGLAIDAEGNLYVAETGRNRVRRIGSDGKIRTVAGSGQRIFSLPGGDVGDGGPAGGAAADTGHVSIDRDGGLLIADCRIIECGAWMGTASFTR